MRVSGWPIATRVDNLEGCCRSGLVARSRWRDLLLRRLLLRRLPWDSLERPRLWDLSFFSFFSFL